MLDLRAAMNGRLRRMHNVQRYSSVPVIRPESVAEHSWQITMLCYLIGKDLQTRGYDIWLERLLSKAVVHDVSETLSGDIIRSYKHSSDEMREACEKADYLNMGQLVSELGIAGLMQDWADAKDETLDGRVVAMADGLCVISYCVAEHRLGNHEVDGVLRYLYETVLCKYHDTEPLNVYVDAIFPNKHWDDAYKLEKES